MTNPDAQPPSYSACNEGNKASVQLQMIMNASLDLICTFDKNVYFLEVSNASIALLGYYPHEMVGRHFSEFICIEDLLPTNSLVKQVQAGNNAANFVNRYKRKEGGLVTLEWSATVDLETGILYCIGRNISEKMRYEDEQEKYKAKLEKSYKSTISILESITDGLITVNENGNITYWNKAAEKIFNKSRGEVLNKNVWDCFPEAAGTVFQEQYAATLQQQAANRFEAHYPVIDKWLQINAYPWQGGIAIYFNDITDRKLAEEAVAKSEKSYRLLFNNLGLPTWIYDRETYRILMVNTAAIKHYGYSREEFLQLTLLDIRPKEDIAATIQSIKASKEKDIVYKSCWTHRKKNGELIKVEISSSLIDYEGREANMVMMNDITEKTKLQERLMQEKLLRQKQLTKATIAAQENERSAIGRELHDNVNQVLTTVKLYNELCLNSDADAQKELLHKSVHYLNACIEEIRSLSKALSAPTIGKIYLKDSIKELVASIQLTNKLKIVYTSDGIEGRAFEQELHIAVYRIIQEHFTNILRHAHASSATLYIVASCKELLITITDNGSGFDPAISRKGVGITNMINRTQILNGTLEINSAPDRGCTLTVRLPIVDSEA